MAVDEGDQVRAERSLARIPNPFHSAAALGHSNYCHFDGTRLERLGAETQVSSASAATSFEPTTLTSLVHDGFRALTLNEHFSCVGAKAAIRQSGYRFGLYEALGSRTPCEGLAHDLFRFIHDQGRLQSEFSTYVASFAGPLPPDEATFERLLWTTLQQLHELDAVYHRWDRSVAANPNSPQFSFSFGERAFFVVGLHAASSRATRRFAWPTLIFNPHDQFERLKATGRYPRFKSVIRAAETNLQGDINPMLTDFGDRSEAAQYSGRHVEGGWKCPFHAQPVRTEREENDTT